MHQKRNENEENYEEYEDLMDEWTFEGYLWGILDSALKDSLDGPTRVLEPFKVHAMVDGEENPLNFECWLECCFESHRSHKIVDALAMDAFPVDYVTLSWAWKALHQIIPTEAYRICMEMDVDDRQNTNC